MKKAAVFLFLALLAPLLGFSWPMATAYGKTEFTYVSTGVSFPKTLITDPDSLLLKASGFSLTLGKRYSLSPKMALDSHLGFNGNPIERQTFFFSTGLLLYTSLFQGTYAGTSISCSLTHQKHRSFASQLAFPILLGYQWPSKQFFQSEWTLKQATFSYGFSF